VHEAAHQQVIPLVRRPEQLEAGHRRPLADLGAHPHQPFGQGEVFGLMGERQVVAVQALLHSGERQAAPLDPERCEQFGQGGAVLHRHRIAAVQHHRHMAGAEQQSQQGQQGGGAGAAVVGHAETERPLSGAGEAGAVAPVAVEHAGELDRLGAADAVGDQEGADLGVGGFACEHQIQAFAGFLAAEARAGVFAAAHLGQQLGEAGGASGQPLQALGAACCPCTGCW